MIRRAILFTIFLAGTALAQTSVSTPSPAATPKIVPQTPIQIGNQEELGLLQLSMAENMYLTNATLENKAGIILALEKLVVVSCFSTLLRDLSYQIPASSKCQGYAERLLEQNQDNPLALCARDGFDSQGCRTAFSQQAVAAVGSPGITVPEHVLMELKLHLTKNAVRTEQLNVELAKTVQQLQNKPSLEASDEFRKALGQVLAIQCFSPQVALKEVSARPTVPPPPVPTSKVIPDPSYSDLQAAIHTLKATSSAVELSKDALEERYGVHKAAQPPPEPQATPAPYQLRVRVLPPDCLQFIAQALRLDPKSPEAICYRDSFVAPSCLDAVKAARAIKRPAKKGAGSNQKPRDGLDNF